MLPHILPQPVHLNLTNAYASHYPATPLSRPRPDSAHYYDDTNHFVVSKSQSFSDSPPEYADDDQFPSPISPSKVTYPYAHHGSGDTANSPSAQYIQILEKNSSYSTSADRFAPNNVSSQDGYRGVAQHPSHSPSPIDTSASRQVSDAFTTLQDVSCLAESKPPSFSQLSAPHNQDHFSSAPSDLDRFSFGVTDRPAQETRQPTSVDEYSSNPYSAVLTRRMSEPAIFRNGSHATLNSYDTTAGRYPWYSGSAGSPRSSNSSYPPSLHRGSSTSSLRELHNHQHQMEFATHPCWKHEEQPQLESYDSCNSNLDDPVSPLNPTFSGDSPLVIGLQYPILEDHYGPSPPGTGTSTSSNNPILKNSTMITQNGSHSDINNGVDQASLNSNDSNKTYAFVALPGNAVKKRPRRRYDEIERLYQCSWQECSKAYGTLNHLNAHVTMQKHGPKRSPNEFKELRKQWRRAKKEFEENPGGTLQRSNSFIQETDQDLSFYGNHGHQQQRSLRHRASFPHQLGFPSSTAISGANGRYGVPIENIHYLTHNLDRRRQEREFSRRASFAGTPASWHPGMTHPSPMHLYYSAGLQARTPHPVVTMGINIASPASSVPPSTDDRVGGLPPGSTLLTPLPGYEPSPVFPPVEGDSEVGYEAYDTYGRICESDGRPSSGHASLGGTSADGDYDV